MCRAPVHGDATHARTHARARARTTQYTPCTAWQMRSLRWVGPLLGRTILMLHKRCCAANSAQANMAQQSLYLMYIAYLLIVHVPANSTVHLPADSTKECVRTAGRCERGRWRACPRQPALPTPETEELKLALRLKRKGNRGTPARLG